MQTVCVCVCVLVYVHESRCMCACTCVYACVSVCESSRGVCVGGWVGEYVCLCVWGGGGKHSVRSVRFQSTVHSAGIVLVGYNGVYL